MKQLPVLTSPSHRVYGPLVVTAPSTDELMMPLHTQYYTEHNSQFPVSSQFIHTIYLFSKLLVPSYLFIMPPIALGTPMLEVVLSR